MLPHGENKNNQYIYNWKNIALKQNKGTEYQQNNIPGSDAIVKERL